MVGHGCVGVLGVGPGGGGGQALGGWISRVGHGCGGVIGAFVGRKVACCCAR